METISKLGSTVSRPGTRFVGSGSTNGHRLYWLCTGKYGNKRSNKWRAGSLCNPVIQPIVPHSLVKKAGPCGGSGGQLRDMDLTGVTRIIKVGVRHCDTVDAIIVYFERDGHEECIGLWGEHGGHLTEFYLQPNEYITSVKGHLGYFKHIYLVRSLTLETNLATYGPYGQQDGIPFELPAINGEIIGFHGRSGMYLDAIGIYIKVANTAEIVADSTVDTSISISTSTVIVEETDHEICLVEGREEIVEETIEESITDASTTTTVHKGIYGRRLDVIREAPH
ncbi:Mannose-binding lectin superfamily protein [Rhynchospora pubera]|uniref:Mannose-binding lectin superfamily protein n=1 Tax=Rhynchospora pubera TaxID=906938 RepID=A0AAV8GQL6_9POAL|nr:Mannose-binding lectin superfamily protein [Rhynchospora pubera]